MTKKTVLAFALAFELLSSGSVWSQQEQHRTNTVPQVGVATQKILNEQRDDVNRSEGSAFNAELAGRAYQKYTDTYTAGKASASSPSAMPTFNLPGSTGTAK